MSAYRTKEIDDYRMGLGLRGIFLDKPFIAASPLGAVQYLLATALRTLGGAPMTTSSDSFTPTLEGRRAGEPYSRA
jgi:hypothetical protein